MSLNGKNILITGASTGLGKELSFQLAKTGSNLILLARTVDKLENLTNSIRSSGGNAHFYACDLKNEYEVNEVITIIASEHKTIDVLINNAGIWTDDELEQKGATSRLSTLETNILGQIHITEAMLPILKKQKHAIIFNVISSAGVADIPAGDNRIWKTYGASKWGFTGYTQALRESLRDTSIKVIQFFPGGFESDLYENAGRDNAHNQPWMMQTKDVAEIVVFALNRPDDVYMEKIVVTKK